MKFQIPLTALEAWPGMHTSFVLVRALGIWHSCRRHVCWQEKAIHLLILLQIINVNDDVKSVMLAVDSHALIRILFILFNLKLFKQWIVFLGWAAMQPVNIKSNFLFSLLTTTESVSFSCILMNLSWIKCKN